MRSLYDEISIILKVISVLIDAHNVEDLCCSKEKEIKWIIIASWWLVDVLINKELNWDVNVVNIKEWVSFKNNNVWGNKLITPIKIYNT